MGALFVLIRLLHLTSFPFYEGRSYGLFCPIVASYVLNRESLQIALDARDDGRFAMDEFLARDLFIHLNIAARHLFHKLEWCVGKRRVLVRIAVLPEPQPEEFLVEILRLLSRPDARLLAFEMPVSGRIRRMYLVDEHEI